MKRVNVSINYCERSSLKSQAQVKSLAARPSWKLQEKVKRVVSRACWKFKGKAKRLGAGLLAKSQEQVKSLPSKACWKAQEKVQSAESNQERVGSSRGELWVWHQERFGSSERKIDFKSAVSRVISTSLKEKNQECVGKTRERESSVKSVLAVWRESWSRSIKSVLESSRQSQGHSIRSIV